MEIPQLQRMFPTLLTERYDFRGIFRSHGEWQRQITLQLSQKFVWLRDTINLDLDVDPNWRTECHQWGLDLSQKSTIIFQDAICFTPLTLHWAGQTLQYSTAFEARASFLFYFRSKTTTDKNISDIHECATVENGSGDRLSVHKLLCLTATPFKS